MLDTLGWLAIGGIVATLLAAMLPFYLGMCLERRRGRETLGREVSRLEGRFESDRAGGVAQFSGDLSVMFGRVLANVDNLAVDIAEIRTTQKEMRVIQAEAAERATETAAKADAAHRDLKALLQGQIDKLVSDVASLRRSFQSIVSERARRRKEKPAQ